MPYFEEWHVNHATANWSSATKSGANLYGSNGFSNVDLAKIITYRTSPKTGALRVDELPREKADPYAIFMSQNRAKRDAAEHRGFDSSLFQEDRGHPFELQRFVSEGTLWSGHFFTSGSTGVHFQGENLDLGEYIRGQYSIPFGFAPVGWTALDSYAQTAYAKSAPTPSMFNLAQFIGEVHEGLPRFGLQLLTKSKTFKALGSDYLNVEFGWKPFLSDLQSAGEALLGATTALLGPRGPLHRLRREDPGLSMQSQNIGNSRIFPITWEKGSSTARVSDVHASFLPLMGATNPQGLGQSDLGIIGQLLLSERTESERWFEGSFTFIPRIGFNPDSYLDKLGELMSADITPSTLWELAPWSWLVDWFLKIGNTIAANEVASDNRIMSNYAYAMEKRVTTRAALATGLSASNYAGPNNLVRQWVTTGKRRIRANPYGFKPMTTANLNTNQWLIMAALGLTTAGR